MLLVRGVRHLGTAGTINGKLKLATPCEKLVYVPASLQTKAEIVFEDYLTRHGIVWEYETLPGLKKPDYVIPHASGKCIIEVKQIEDSHPRPTHGFNPDRPVRAKIRRARKQLGEYKEYPCSLALYSESIFGPYEPSIMLAAAFGAGYQQAGRDYSRIDPNPSFLSLLQEIGVAAG